MLLARTMLGETYPIMTIARRLGIGDQTIGYTVRSLERVGVVMSYWESTRHLVGLNPDFCAYYAIRRLATRMDRECGGEYAGIARLRHSDRVKTIRRKRQSRTVRGGRAAR